MPSRKNSKAVLSENESLVASCKHSSVAYYRIQLMANFFYSAFANSATEDTRRVERERTNGTSAVPLVSCTLSLVNSLAASSEFNHNILMWIEAQILFIECAADSGAQYQWKAQGENTNPRRAQWMKMCADECYMRERETHAAFVCESLSLFVMEWQRITHTNAWRVFCSSLISRDHDQRASM
jgi:hypothetical protein